MSKQFEKLSSLLKELFQTNQADLDFGIYRVINQRRDEINKFLDEELLAQVNRAFKQYEAVDTNVLNMDLKTAIKQAEDLGINPEEAPRVKQIREQFATYGVNLTDLENQVYSALYNFFSRYYDEGDFISQRRYKEGVYAIPYEGEEVKLHWANNDQFYIKTSEYFRDYSFKLPSGKLAHFKVSEAEVEKDNRKEGDEKKRRFILAKDPLSWTNNEPVFHFHFKADDQSRSQSKCNDDAIKGILKLREKEKDAAKKQILLELASQAPTEKNANRTLIEKHLEDYTRRNTQDYFIHKDLGKFLRRELDFYIKNEIMQLDNIESEAAPRVEQYLSKVRVIRAIAHRLIDFLAQIENFQRKLWLKKKFVVETNYCITLDRIPEEFYPEIAANDAQREEWVRLFAIDEIKRGDMFSVPYSKPLTTEFLKANPYLVLDTVFFEKKFYWKILETFSDIDEVLDSQLIYGENYQVLNLIGKKHHEGIKCVHIDPPYNTQTSGFLYKNNYQHSSWLSMMENRIDVALPLLSATGSFQCHIDENEYERLQLLFNHFPIPDAGTVAWDKRNPMNAGRGIATQHEYVIWHSWQETPLYLRDKNVPIMLEKAKGIIKKYRGVTDEARQEYASWVNANSELSGGERAYRYIDDDGNVYQSVSLRAPEPRTDSKFFEPLIHPVTKRPCAVPPNGFSRTPETLREMQKRGEILFGQDETTQPRQKVLLHGETRRQASSVIQNGQKGKADVSAMGLDFPYCHPVSLYEELIGAVAQDDGEVILDFFAGSGTTGHAVINLSREDHKHRKFILVELGEHFTKVLKPRIQKAIYSTDWKDGKPRSRKGSSHAFKYFRVESYEDTLNNLELFRKKDQQLALETSADFRTSYFLRYMLDVESKGSLLNIEKFNTPFDYHLMIANAMVGEATSENVDLVETFNYLLGMHVKEIRHIDGAVIVRGRSRDEQSILVIWRNVSDMNDAALGNLFKKHIAPGLGGVTDVYINGDNNLANLKSKSDTWNVHLTEEAFLRLMFEETRE
ncbi:MAG TPA: site-specific DNA-methyltransferase [Anaerolineales bacterium]|nr:site-specific DNA-methyltransferase [Anaerolineales bacterium]